MSDLIVVETPLQLLNAVEAVRVFKADEVRMVVLLTEAFSRRRFDALSAALPTQPWRKTRYVRLKTRFPADAKDGARAGVRERCYEYWNDLHRVANRYRLWMATWGARRPRRVFLGNYLDEYKPYFRHVANAFARSEIVLLDDGTDAVMVAAQRLQYHRLAEHAAATVPPVVPGALRRIVTCIRRAVLDWNAAPRAAVTFFSAFDIDVHPSDLLVKHSYSMLRALRTEQVQSSEVWILGQCLSEDGFVTTMGYVEAVCDIVRRLGADSVVYVPHPRESAETVAAVTTMSGATIRRFDVPVEFALLRAARVPSAVASFYCTALINISLIFSETISVHSYVLEPPTVIRHHAQVAGVYAAMRKLSDMGVASLHFLTGDARLLS